MKRVLSILMCLCLFMTTGCSRQEKIRFGAAGIGGMYYPFANAFTELASKDEPEIHWKVKSTAGSANLHGIRSRGSGRRLRQGCSESL